MLLTAIGDLDRLGVNDARTHFFGEANPFTKVSPRLCVPLLEDPVLARLSSLRQTRVRYGGEVGVAAQAEDPLRLPAESLVQMIF